MLLGFPMRAVARALDTTLWPCALHGCEFLMLRADMQKRLDALQDRVHRMVLDLQSPVSRILLMEEVGALWRLSTTVAAKAIRLLAAVEMLPEDHVCHRVMMIAARTPSTWTSATQQLMASWGVKNITDIMCAQRTDRNKPLAECFTNTYHNTSAQSSRLERSRGSRQS